MARDNSEKLGHMFFAYINLQNRLYGGRGHTEGLVNGREKTNKLVINLSLEASQVVLVVKNPPAIAGKCKKCGFDPRVGKILWKRKRQPTPVFLPEKSYGQGSLAGYSPWDH